jgi:hypothetical protein
VYCAGVTKVAMAKAYMRKESLVGPRVPFARGNGEVRCDWYCTVVTVGERAGQDVAIGKLPSQPSDVSFLSQKRLHFFR